jgi:hypothetical protein
MTLSNGQIVDAKSVDDKCLRNEERVFFNRYKKAIHSTFNARNSDKFYQALEHEIQAFNKWQFLIEELYSRKIR